MTISYIAKPVDVFEYRPGGWRGTKVGVFRIENDKEEQLGEYVRNYGTFFHTFFPFERNGRHLALYSSEYTATRIMELPSCKDLGGEEPHEMGFCPVDYFVPSYIDQEVVTTSNNPANLREQISIRRVNNPTDEALAASTHEYTYTNLVLNQECHDRYTSKPVTSIMYYDFGFVSGCIWGDESTWKVQYLDLSDADKGILKRDDRFGYVELPDNLRLRDAIDMYDYGYCDVSEDEIAGCIRISTLQTFDLKTGTIVRR